MATKNTPPIEPELEPEAVLVDRKNGTTAVYVTRNGTTERAVARSDDLAAVLEAL